MSSMWTACEWISSHKLDDVKIHKFDDVFTDFCHSTPWLTTRRRTCPICKNDIVKSLARGSPSSPHYEPYHDDSEYTRPEPSSFVSSNTGSYSSNRLSDVEEGREALARVQREIHEVRWYDFMAHLLRGEPGQAFLNRHENRRFAADDREESRL